jgi:hypothetical protein
MPSASRFTRLTTFATHYVRSSLVKFLFNDMKKLKKRLIECLRHLVSLRSLVKFLFNDIKKMKKD